MSPLRKHGSIAPCGTVVPIAQTLVHPCCINGHEEVRGELTFDASAQARRRRVAYGSLLSPSPALSRT